MITRLHVVAHHAEDLHDLALAAGQQPHGLADSASAIPSSSRRCARRPLGLGDVADRKQSGQPPRGSRPSARLSATSRCGHSASSWKTVSTPASRAAAGSSPRSRVRRPGRGPRPAGPRRRSPWPASTCRRRCRRPGRRPRRRRRSGSTRSSASTPGEADGHALAPPARRRPGRSGRPRPAGGRSGRRGGRHRRREPLADAPLAAHDEQLVGGERGEQQDALGDLLVPVGQPGEDQPGVQDRRSWRRLANTPAGGRGRR